MSSADECKPLLQRPRPMKVLVLGLCRTGTSSLYVAQKELGMRPYHFRDIIFKPEHMALWLKAMKAKYDGIGKPFQGRDFDQMLGEYDSVADTPACFFVEELLAAYPEAKVILTVRSPESWLQSMQNTLITVVSWRSWNVLSFFDYEHSAFYWPLFNRIMRVMSKGNAPWKPSAAPSFLEFFDEHYALVRHLVPKDRLLEWHPSQGWDPLCDFLELPVPAKEFPHGIAMFERTKRCTGADGEKW
ncbi:hypothetical protein N7461_008096 [Penicillium sp. DV-2018c]|nr:hypothetical protein N7461_008096 [Penicillium sp. DV-2018c]